MRTISADRLVPDGRTATEYLREALDGEWGRDVEYLGNRADLERAWALQNELRVANGLDPLSDLDLAEACGHLGEES